MSKWERPEFTTTSTQQPCLDELVQRIVDGRERHPDRGLDRFAVQLLGGDVPVTLLEQEPDQRQPLSGRT